MTTGHWPGGATPTSTPESPYDARPIHPRTGLGRSVVAVVALLVAGGCSTHSADPASTLSVGFGSTATLGAPAISLSPPRPDATSTGAAGDQPGPYRRLLGAADVDPGSRPAATVRRAG